MAYRLTPNPYSPYATASPDTRHILPTLAFLGDPTPGSLVLTGCEYLAVVPEQTVETQPGAELPDGLCHVCIAAMNGADEPRRPAVPCTECGMRTTHDGLCAMCRAEKHDEWRAAQSASA